MGGYFDMATRAQILAYKSIGMPNKEITQRTGARQRTIQGILAKAKLRGWTDIGPVRNDHVADIPKIRRSKKVSEQGGATSEQAKPVPDGATFYPSETIANERLLDGDEAMAEGESAGENEEENEDETEDEVAMSRQEGQVMAQVDNGGQIDATKQQSNIKLEGDDELSMHGG